MAANPEIVIDGKTGWVVPSDNLPVFVRAIERAVSDEKFREKIGQAGQKRFFDRFEFHRMVNAYDRLYRTTGQGG